MRTVPATKIYQSWDSKTTSLLLSKTENGVLYRRSDDLLPQARTLRRYGYGDVILERIHLAATIDYFLE